MNRILNRYGELLQEVDRWFSDTLAAHPDLIACRPGCSACCRGLFDITVLDALYLQQGVTLLPQEEQQQLRQLAVQRLQALSSICPDYHAPWFLNHLSDQQQETLMPEDDPTPCILLSAAGECRVYHNRPMTCRLHGIPLFDSDGEPFSDEWCSLNFIDLDPAQLIDIRHGFRDLFSRELLLFRELTALLYGAPCNELDTLIPAALLISPLDTPPKRA